MPETGQDASHSGRSGRAVGGGAGGPAVRGARAASGASASEASGPPSGARPRLPGPSCVCAGRQRAGCGGVGLGWVQVCQACENPLPLSKAQPPAASDAVPIHTRHWKKSTTHLCHLDRRRALEQLAGSGHGLS
jgi:hypothetical protein